MSQFHKRSPMPVSAADLFAWHARPGAFERLNPPWQPVEVLSHTGGIKDGARVELKVPLPIPPLSLRWKLEHSGYIEGKQFKDSQVSGPFSHWEHTHLFIADGEQSSILDDSITYRMPLGVLGDLANSLTLARDLPRLFTYRHTVTRNDLTLIQKYNLPRKRIIISGASGLVGKALSSFLSVAGHEVVHLVRRPAKGSSEIFWDPAEGILDAGALEGCDAVINLSGENVAGGRWNEERKRAILESRTTTTSLLAQRCRELSKPPAVFINAAAVGFYGNRGEETLTECSVAGSGYLVDVAKRWEECADAAQSLHTRVVKLRIGIILSPRGGALEKMLPPFLLGAGGPVGSGGQFMSWIALDDVIGAIYHALATPSLSGPVNLTAERPVTNFEFTKTLGAVISRPTIAPLPEFVVGAMFGEMGRTLLLGSTRAIPEVLRTTKYEFLFPNLEGALRHLLGRV